MTSFSVKPNIDAYIDYGARLRANPGYDFMKIGEQRYENFVYWRTKTVKNQLFTYFFEIKGTFESSIGRTYGK